MFKACGLYDIDYLELSLSLWPGLWAVFTGVSECLQSVSTFCALGPTSVPPVDFAQR